jgi:hypothetical protein
MRKRISRTGLLAVTLVLAWAAWSGLDRLRVGGELHQAQKEIAQGRYEPARQRLTALSASRPGAMGGQVDYWLGICESSLGRYEGALAAFGRVPTSHMFEPQAAYLEAEANLRQGRLRAA